MKMELIKFSIVALILLIVIFIWVKMFRTDMPRAGFYYDEVVDIPIEPYKSDSTLIINEGNNSMIVPAEPTNQYINFVVHGESVVIIPYKEECQVADWYKDISKCADIERMKLGKYFTKDNPWNMQCEDGYILHFNRDAIAWCEKDEQR